MELTCIHALEDLEIALSDDVNSGGATPFSEDNLIRRFSIGALGKHPFGS
jgi:hypothetical protein